MKIPLSAIRPSAQPIRSTWDEEALDELAQSIKEQGLIVPVKVRPADGGYELVYGHRRTEAARRAGLTEIEAIVEGMDDTDALIQALIENVQREDMEPMDLARALKALMNETGWSLRELDRRGIMESSRAAVTVALLQAPPDVQGLVTRAPSGDVPPGKVTEGHVREARRGARGDDQVITATIHKAAHEGLTRQQTRAVAEAVKAASTPERKKALLDAPYSPYTHDPEIVRQQAATPDFRPTPGQEWERAPEAQAVLQMVSIWRKAIAESRQAARLGKLSPEARRFVAHRLRTVADQLQTWIKELEE